MRQQNRVMLLGNRLSMDEWPLSRFKPYAGNARIHDERHVGEIAASMRAFGPVVPVLADPDGEIIAGQGRLKAAEQLKLKSLPVVVLDGLSAAQKKALRLADKKIAVNGRFDADLLRIELQSLFAMDVEFDLEVTGFSTAEIDLALDPAPIGQSDDPDDACPEPPRVPTTRRGDAWRLGDHKLVCGDSRQMWTFARLMRTEEARLVVSDPPYDVSVKHHVGGLGKIKHEEFAFASGEMSREAFAAFLATVFDNAAEYSLDGALHYHFMDWRHVGEMLAAGERVYSELKNLCVWVKDRAGMGSHYRSQHELCFVWKKGRAAHVNTVELGRNGRSRTNVWTCRAATRTGEHAELKLHPSVKPVSLLTDVIKDASRRGDVVLDPFGGSGSTLIAAQKCGRKARLIEYEPKYCDIILQRWSRLTGEAPVLLPREESFDDVRARRARED